MKLLKRKPKSDQDTRLMKLPFFGYFFRKVNKNRKEIETTLKTGKETESAVKKRRFLVLFEIASGKKFSLLPRRKK